MSESSFFITVCDDFQYRIVFQVLSRDTVGQNGLSPRRE